MESKDTTEPTLGFHPREWRTAELLRTYAPEQLARMLDESERYCKKLEAQCAEKDKVIEELGKMYAEKDGQHQVETKKFQRAKALFYAAFEYVPKSKPGTKKALVANVVKRIEEWHHEQGMDFDRWSMPGDAGDLLWLMSLLRPEKFAEMELNSFRPHYAGVCKWHRGAGTQKGARGTYIEIFPQLKDVLAAARKILSN